MSDKNHIEKVFLRLLVANPKLVTGIQDKVKDDFFKNYKNKIVFNKICYLVSKEEYVTFHSVLEYLKDDEFSDISLFLQESETEVLDFEKKFLSTIISNPKILDSVGSKITKDDFLDHKNRVIFQSIFEMVEKGDIIIPSTLIKYIENQKMLEFVGGKQYIISLLPLAPLAFEYEYYIKKIIDFSIVRYIEKELVNLNNLIFEKKIDKLFLAIENVNDTLERKRFTKTGIKNLNQLSKDFINIIYSRTEKVMLGVESGYHDLDELTQGFQKSELIIIGARPSIGKTALAVCMLANITISDPQKNKEGLPAGFFSLEMTDIAIMQRIYSCYGQISNESIRKSTLTRGNLAKIENISDRIANAKLYVCDLPNIKLSDLKSISKEMKSLYDIQILFIDYIGLITVDNFENHPRHEQVSIISRNLKSLARDLQIPVVALSQVTRDADNKEPTLAHLRDSGSLEQDADVVMFLHRNRQVEEGKNTIDTDLVIAKQRNGPIDTVKLLYLPEYTRFESYINYE